MAAAEGAQLVCLQELTLSPYFAVSAAGPEAEGVFPEDLPGGPTHRFAAGVAGRHGLHVHASLYERAPARAGLQHGDRGGARRVDVARTRKLHIPVTAGYHEDRYFRPGPADAVPFPVVSLDQARFGFPTCWDQWFPELARPTASRAPTCWSTRRPSALSPTTPTSTPSRCGRR